MTSLLENLRPNQRKGSKPRCHWLTHGSAEEVAVRLTELIKPWGRVSETGSWMPKGFDAVIEAQLHNAPALLKDFDAGLGAHLQCWWFAVGNEKATSPNWDIASTCTVTVDGRSKPGLLLVEAKAHDWEGIKEEAGKPLGPPKEGSGISMNSRRNHVRIGACIQDASLALADETGLPWALSRDWNYQMSNRFAWSCKLTELGIPVILVYLGFLNAEEMRKGKAQKPFADHAEWEALVKSHSHPLFPEEVWDRPWTLHDQSFIPLIRSLDMPYDRPSTEAEA